MVRYSTKEIGKQTLQLRFQDLNFEETFDGVWANASLIHIPYEETKNVYVRIYKALKPGGVFYGSYKYGKGHMSVSGREFYNMTEASILPYFENLFEVIKISKTEDTRSQVAPSPDKAWLNFIVKKENKS
jgi:SAM-dependent methyltransferase